MQVEYSGPKIIILLSKKDFAEYRWLKSTNNWVALTTAIVFPVLVEAIRFAQADNNDDLRWVRALQRRIETMELKLKDEPLELAQKILELPLKRTFASARMLAENAS